MQNIIIAERDSIKMNHADNNLLLGQIELFTNNYNQQIF